MKKFHITVKTPADGERHCCSVYEAPSALVAVAEHIRASGSADSVDLDVIAVREVVECDDGWHDCVGSGPWAYVD